MRIVWLLSAALQAFIAAIGYAAPHPPTDPFTEKERSQGFSDRVILAKPLARSRARLDAEEIRDGVRVREKFSRLGDLRVVHVDPGESVEAAIARLRATGRYEFVEPDFLLQPDATPNDPAFSSQWSLNNTGQLAGSTVGVDIDAPAAWDLIHDAPDVIVAVIDNGIRENHADLAANLWVNPAPTIGDVHGLSIIRGVRSADIGDDNGHGTRVAGIIGAVGNNGIGITGVAWSVKLMILKNAAEEGGSLTSDSAACMDYAVAHGAHIINCSFGGTGFSQTFFTAIRAAREAGVIVVTSAGNDSTNNDVSPHYPSNYLSDNVVSVGNSGPTDAISSSSSYGASVELLAPGSAIVLLDFQDPTGSSTRTGSGTSYSSPHVAGALALLKARFPTDTYSQIINRLLRGAELKSSFAGRALTNGRLNLMRALTTTTNRPFNDDFTTRAIVTGSTLALRANNRDATTEILEPAHAGIGAAGTLWWQWVAASTGAVAIDTVGSSYDTILAIYTGSSLGALTPVVSNDDDLADGSSRVTFNVTATNSYLIAIASKSGASGYVQLNVAASPANDQFAGAVALTGESARAATALNNVATAEPGEPSILGNPTTATLWYKWTAPRSGRFQVSAFTTHFDILLAVYTGSALGNLSLVAASDDTNSAATLFNTDSRCTIDALAGVTYYFQTDTKSGNRGSVSVTVTDSLWQFSTDSNNITSAPAIGLDGTIYLGTTSPDRRLYAITPGGNYLWDYAATGGMDMSTPAIGANGTVYAGFGSGSGKLIAFSPSGRVLWEHAFGSSVSLSPAIAADGTLYTHALDGFLYALNPADGSTRWSLDLGATNTFASATIAPDGTIYQGSNNGILYAINPNGTLKWQYDAGAVILSTPALDAGGNIYFGTYTNSRVISLTPAGTPRWTYTGISTPSAIGSSPVLSADGNTVYIPAADRRLHALNATTGAAVWTYTAANAVFGSTPAIDSNGVIYFGAYDGKLYAINPNGTLKRTWDTAQLIRGSPIIFGSTLYVASSDGKLYAFDIGAQAGGGPWPQFRQNVRNLGRADFIPPASRSASPGSSLTLDIGAVGQGAVVWTRNGSSITGATNPTLTLPGFQPIHTGIYQASVTANGFTTTTHGAIIGLASAAKLVGPGTEFPDIFHAGTGFTYDQILLEAGAASVKADAGQILRISFVDLSNDIVQVEFSGAGTLSLVLDGVSGPAIPQNYNQNVTYMKGHAGIVLSGANATTNLSVFSVGRANAANQALFKDSVTYDGFADVAFVAITSTDGRFGGLRTANASYFGTRGLTGVYAPGVEFTGPVFVGDIRASDNATPVLTLGSGSDVRITGGDLLPDNGRAVQVSGLTQLRFTAGSNSHGTNFPAQANRARLEQNGIDVTTQIVVNPTP